MNKKPVEIYRSTSCDPRPIYVSGHERGDYAPRTQLQNDCFCMPELLLGT